MEVHGICNLISKNALPSLLLKHEWTACSAINLFVVHLSNSSNKSKGSTTFQMH